MARPTALRPRTARGPSFWGACLGLLLLLPGLLDLHPAGVPHTLNETAAVSEYAPEAAHPGQPAHLEPGAVVSRPGCPVCLQRLQLGGLHLAPAPGLVPPAAREVVAVAGVVAATGRRLAPSGARAPPLS